VLVQRRAGQTRFYGNDAHGNVRLLTDPSGTITDTYGYLPYGDALYDSGGTTNPVRFNAERFEPAVRAYDLRQRSYDSCSGSFLSRDPFPGIERRPFSLHPYQFGDADPINHADPLGLITLPEISITQAIQMGQRIVNLGVKARALCKAKAGAAYVDVTVVGILMLSTYMQLLLGGYTSPKIEVPLPKGAKFVWAFELKANASKRSLDGKLTASIAAKGESKTTGSVTAEREGGKWSIAADASLTIFELRLCVAKVGEFKLKVEGKKVEAEDGHLTFSGIVELGAGNDDDLQQYFGQKKLGIKAPAFKVFEWQLF
jgi:RHS repeat-associated protein